MKIMSDARVEKKSRVLLPSTRLEKHPAIASVMFKLRAQTTLIFHEIAPLLRR